MMVDRLRGISRGQRQGGGSRFLLESDLQGRSMAYVVHMCLPWVRYGCRASPSCVLVEASRPGVRRAWGAEHLGNVVRLLGGGVAVNSAMFAPMEASPSICSG